MGLEIWKMRLGMENMPTREDYFISSQNLKNKPSPKKPFLTAVSLLKCALAPGSMVTNTAFPGLLRKMPDVVSVAGSYNANEDHLIGQKVRKLMRSCQNYTRANHNGPPIGQSCNHLGIKRRKLAEVDSYFKSEEP